MMYYAAIIVEGTNVRNKLNSLRKPQDKLVSRMLRNRINRSYQW